MSMIVSSQGVTLFIDDFTFAEFYRYRILSVLSFGDEI